MFWAIINEPHRAACETLTWSSIRVNWLGMKKLKFLAGIVLAIAFISISSVARADDTNSVSSTPPPKPD